MTADQLRLRIREIPDHPKPGILFKDITPLLADPEAWRVACEAMAAPWDGQGITHVVAVESRGFLFGGAIAARLGAGLVPVRKPGKLPFERSREEYALEYGTDALEMHVDAVGPASRVIVVDDVLATGGTAAATVRLVERHGAAVVGCGFLIELSFLGGRAAVGKRVESVITY
ncbi:MAG: adenine phosphoribosyltransferase [Gemmatimonadetes bacterium]|nr:adenine phosphoribosyltransferase [Gemmatimonadota bacterium]